MVDTYAAVTHYTVNGMLFFGWSKLAELHMVRLMACRESRVTGDRLSLRYSNKELVEDYNPFFPDIK